MDLIPLLSFLESDLPTMDTDNVPQPSCSNQSQNILQAFCSDKDFVDKYLGNSDQLNNQNHEQQFYDSSIENWFYSDGQTNLFEGSLAVENLNPPIVDIDWGLQSDTSTLQPSCSNQSLNILQTFWSNEDTVKKYLLDGDESNNQNNEQQHFSQPTEFCNSSMSNWFNLNNSTNQSDSLRIIQNSTSVSTSISSSNDPTNSLWTIENQKLDSNCINSYITTDRLNGESLYQFKRYNTYKHLKLNFIRLVELGYKLTLSLNTDNSEVYEPWNPDVGQKILSVDFSTLDLKRQYFSDEVQLDEFELMFIYEACKAFGGQKNLNLFSNLQDRRKAKASPDRLISICNGIKGYRKIGITDKITLLSSIYYQLHGADGIINYDPKIDGWDAPSYDFKHDRRDSFLFNQFLHDGLVYVLESFPDRLRNDINTIILMYLIIIFNPDTAGLKYPEIIRYEQFSYIYLLRRYLRTICKSDCEASDNHYRLMAKIEQLRILGAHAKKELIFLLVEPVDETITKAVTIDYQKSFVKISRKS